MSFQRCFMNACMRYETVLSGLRRPMSGMPDMSRTHRTTNFEKKVLVWTKTGNFKTVEEVPEYVGQQVMEKARNRMRIRVANIMMALTALGCLSMIILGKRAHERGESVEKMGREWHEAMNEKARSN